MRRVFLPFAAASLAGLAFAAAAAARSERPVGPRQLTFALYGTEDGLDSLTVFDLSIDRVGNLWIGTQEGLARFDGERFRSFGVADGLPSGVVFDVEEDIDGVLWAATLKGVARFDGQRFESVALPGSPAGEAVEALTLDAGGRLVAGAVGGAWRCDIAACARIFELPPDMFVSALALDRTTGELWFGGPFGLVRWRDREIERFTRERGLPSHSTRALLVDRYGALWVRQLRELVRLDTNDGEVEVVTELPPAADSSRLYEDSRGVVWVTSDAGLYHRTADGWRRIGIAEGLPEGAVSAVVEDEEGALWIGLAHAGLARWLGRDRFVSWTSETGLPSDVVWAIERGAGGRLAFGTNAGLALLGADATEIATWPGDPLLGVSPVIAVTADDAGGFWIGNASGGLAYVDTAGRVVDAGARSAFTDDTPITRIVRRGDGEIWLATSTGLWRGRGSPERIRFERVVVPGASPEGDGDPAPPEIFFDLLEARDGTLWAAGRYGLARLRDGVWTRLTKADGLLDDFLLSIAEDRVGALWIGYRDARGVSVLAPAEGVQRLVHLDSRSGLRHDQVTFVRTDALGRIWIGTTRGISVRSGDRFVNFRRSDGLISEDACSNAFHADRDGTTWIGTPAGAVAARIAEPDLAPRPPLAARIVTASLGGEPFPSDGAPNVPHDRATFEVAFAAHTFRAPREVEFRYQLTGADVDPVVTRQRTARYPALPEGEHEFRVEARLEGSGWGPPTTLRFTVAPPWWASVPARLGALALAVFAGLAIDRFRARRDRRRSEQLERAVADRTEELRASREELERKNDELAHLSLTDPLTGLKNRRYAWEFLAAEVERVDREWSAAGDRRPEARLVFFLMDVDLFKSINDLHGHEIGDRILIEAAERVREATRISDVAVRWGGEEFLVIARDLPPSEWPEFAARLRRTLAEPAFVPSAEIGKVRCTGSLGYAGYPFEGVDGLPWQQVLKLADLALYAVKQCGRNADLGVEPGRNWRGAIPADLLAAQAGGVVHLHWGNVARPRR